MWASRNRRGAVALSLVAIVLLLGAANATGRPGANMRAGQTGPKRGGNLVIARHADSLSMDQTTIFDNETIWIVEQMYEGLYAPSADGRTVVPRLATSDTLSKNKLVWTFHLRPGVKFNNGKPMTAADVVWSLNRDRHGGGFGYVDQAISSISAPNARTVVIRTKHPWAPLIADLAIFDNAVIPKNFGGESKSAFFKHPIATGPFMLQSWTKGSQLKMVRNPYYWQKGKPYLDSVTWTVVPDDNTRILQLKGSQVQIAEFPPYSTIASLKTTPGIQVATFPSTRIDYILMNEHVKPYQDVHVRRAIAYSLDREAMIKAVLFGNGRVANSYMPYKMNFYDASTPGIQYNPAKAKQEMAMSSVPHGFKTQFLVGGTDIFYSSIAEIVQQELKPLGIQVTLKKIDPNNLLSEQEKFHYQISIDYWTNDIVDPDEVTAFDVDPKGGGGQSYFTFYNNPQIVKWVRQAEVTFNTKQRAALYAKIQRAHAREVPQIPLFYSPLAYAFSDKVQGFHVSPLGIYPLADVWLK
jgi:peptide/nickel transport system substrate-binding protein